MYKVFFNDRAVFLTDDFSKYFEERFGLFYKYRNQKDLTELIEFFWKLRSVDNLYIFHIDIVELQEAFKSCFHYVEAAGGVVTNKNNEVLIIHRLGKYDLPKGKLEKGESYQKAAIREIKEECGIEKLEIKRPLISTFHVYINKDRFYLKKTYWFDVIHVGNSKPTPQTEESIEKAFWMPQRDVIDIAGNTYASILDVLRYRKLIPLNITVTSKNLE